jgi:hypothetical protein
MKRFEKLKNILFRLYAIKWIRVVTVLFIIVFYFYNRGQLEHNRQVAINFYTKGNLMYLIDTREDARYDMYTRKEKKKHNPQLIDDSYENYINYVNAHKVYKYNDWRLPTTDELLRLELHDNWLLRPFLSSSRVKNELNIDTNIFYDHILRDINQYWTQTECIDDKGYKGYMIVYFKNRFYQFSHGYGKGHVRGGGGGVTLTACNRRYNNAHIRLVRDSNFWNHIF